MGTVAPVLVALCSAVAEAAGAAGTMPGSATTPIANLEPTWLWAAKDALGMVHGAVAPFPL
eukprot:4164252-Lingulodinium_polyedra.AAC.1